MSSVQWLARNLSLPLDEVHLMLDGSSDQDKAAANLVESLSSTEFLSMLRSRYVQLSQGVGESLTVRDVLMVIADEPVAAQKTKLRFLVRQLQEVRH